MYTALKLVSLIHIQASIEANLTENQNGKSFNINRSGGGFFFQYSINELNFQRNICRYAVTQYWRKNYFAPILHHAPWENNVSTELQLWWSLSFVTTQSLNEQRAFGTVIDCMLNFRDHIHYPAKVWNH